MPNEIRHMLIAACRTHPDIFAKLKNKVEPSPEGQVAKFKPETWRKKGAQTIKGPNKTSGKWKKNRKIVTRIVSEALRYRSNGKPATAFRAILCMLEGFSWDCRIP